MVPFYICNELKAFEVHKDNQTFASTDGVLFDKNMETLLKYPKGRSGEYIVPEMVKRLVNTLLRSYRTYQYNSTKIAYRE